MGEGQWTVRVTRFVTTGVTTTVVTPDPRRITISFTIGNDPIGPMAQAQGWPGGNPEFQIPNVGHLEFKYCDWGPFVAGQWGVSGAGVGVEVWITELLIVNR